MKRIGLLSDTHSHMDEKMKQFLSGLDEIWHAGDIGNFEVIDELKKIAPLRCVYGNIDNYKIRQEYSEKEIFQVEKVNVLMTHIGGYPKKYAPGILSLIKNHNIDLFISGHSHILKVIFDKNSDCLHINPGACGIQGLHRVRTMVRFSVSNSKIENLEIWESNRP